MASAIRSDAEPVIFGKDPDGSSVLTASAAVSRMQWYVFFEQPLSKALQPVYNLLFRTAWLLALGVLGCAGRHTAGATYGYSNSRIAGRRPAIGGERIRPSHRGADPGRDCRSRRHFNRMADQLRGSYGRLEQKVAERTRDLAQSVGELKASRRSDAPSPRRWTTRPCSRLS